MTELLKRIEADKRDAVLFKTDFLLKNAGDDIDARTKAINEIALMLTCIANEIKRDHYMQTISKKFGIKAKLLKTEVDTAKEKINAEKVLHVPEGVKFRFPKGVDPEKAYQDGFYSLIDGLATGYYFPSGGEHYTQQSNFVIKPLMHIQSKSDDKRMFEVTNGIETAVVDMPSRAFISLEQFVGTMYELPGNNLFWGTKYHLMKILQQCGREFEICYELKNLGWQREGFFAYSNGIITGDGFVPMDDRGIAQYGDTKYYSPSASAIYRNSRGDDDDYANDRYLFHREPTINFEQWCARFVKVYTESNSGMIGIAYVLMSIFRDIVFSIDNNSPHLSAYGEKGSGKSKFNESLSNFFFNELPPLNLFHSTDFAFANRISRYRNCLISLDEFNDATIKEERFEAVKASYDGIARERGKGGSKNKTEILTVSSTMALAGQYLSTKDDNAALTRCIIIPFKKRSEETARNNADVKQYEELKNYEKQGLSGLLVEILKYRKEFEKEYLRSFPEQFADLRTDITSAGGVYNERVMRNYCALLTCIHFFSKKFKLPFTADEFREVVKHEVVKLSTLISESDSLADFWNTIVYLLETGEIYEGFHFKIDEVAEIIAKGKKISFPKPTKVLFLRLTTIHKLYMEAHRRGSGKNGVNKETLSHYLTSAKGYLGFSEASRFTNKDGESTNTSCMLFDYHLINVPLERTPKVDDEKVMTEITGRLKGDCRLKEIAGAAKLQYQISDDQSYEWVGKTVEKFVVTTCYDSNHANDSIVTSAHPFTVTGELKVKRFKNKEGEDVEVRTMEVKSCKLVSPQLGFTVGDGKDDLPF